MFEQIHLKNGNEAFNVSKDCLRELKLIVNYGGHKLKTKKKLFCNNHKICHRGRMPRCLFDVVQITNLVGGDI